MYLQLRKNRILHVSFPPSFKQSSIALDRDMLYEGFKIYMKVLLIAIEILILVLVFGENICSPYGPNCWPGARVPVP